MAKKTTNLTVVGIKRKGLGGKQSLEGRSVIWKEKDKKVFRIYIEVSSLAFTVAPQRCLCRRTASVSKCKDFGWDLRGNNKDPHALQLLPLCCS